ncbi:MAG: response regulator transcription factor [Oscillochloris sp.]|nr:response regulator transcription factor [Oscillochloris sp.]
MSTREQSYALPPRLINAPSQGRIFLVARHPNLRSALTLMIKAQSRCDLSVVGATGWGAEDLITIRATQPDVVVLIVGIEASSELRAIAQIRNLAPDCRVLVVDTLGETGIWPISGWASADALLCTKQLATDMIPTICQLLTQSSPSSPPLDGEHTPSSGQE